MAYTKNPYMPKVRRDAAVMVHKGYTPTEVGRRFGVGSSTICKWVKKAQKIGLHPIPTKSSRPKHHPKQLSNELVWKIFHERIKLKRCAEVVHASLRNDGVQVSLSSVKRTLDRTGLINKRSPWKRYHAPMERPQALRPGDLVQMDTIHLLLLDGTRIYVFTAIDVYSRFAWAWATTRVTAKAGLIFLRKFKRAAPFSIGMLQTDRGPEFSTFFTERAKIEHRHSRVRKPNDNAHIERFNRTLQEECLDRVVKDIPTINPALREYLKHYNTTRLHLGINLQTPLQLLKRVQAIDY